MNRDDEMDALLDREVHSWEFKVGTRGGESSGSGNDGSRSSSSSLESLSSDDMLGN